MDKEFYEMCIKMFDAAGDINDDELRSKFHGERFVCDETNNPPNIIENCGLVVFDRITGLSLFLRDEQVDLIQGTLV